MPGPPGEGKSVDAPKWLSTTSGAGRAEGRVELLCANSAAVRGLPGKLLLGAGHPSVITAGRHERNDAVLDSKSASKTHCQFALRSFRLPEQNEIHEALFLRDVSKNNTLVNGSPAFRPWHWLQEGDLIGLPQDAGAGGGSPGQLELFRVRYMGLRKLPASLVTVEELEKEKAAPQRSKPGAGGGEQGHGGKLPAKESHRRPRGQQRGGGPVSPRPPFGEEVVGCVVDLTYVDPPATYRMRITSFDRVQGWHVCDSEGLSLWDGEPFTDEVFLDEFSADGRLQFVGVEGAQPAQPFKRQRKRVGARG